MNQCTAGEKSVGTRSLRPSSPYKHESGSDAKQMAPLLYRSQIWLADPGMHLAKHETTDNKNDNHKREDYFVYLVAILILIFMKTTQVMSNRTSKNRE